MTWLEPTKVTSSQEQGNLQSAKEDFIIFVNGWSLLYLL